MAKLNKAAFLDRDGTINIDKHYMFKISEFEYVKGAIDGIRALSELGYMIVVISNQSGIARGYYTESDYRRLDEWMKKDLKRYGITIAGSYYCPHLPNAFVKEYSLICECRKPKTKLFWDAASELNIDIDSSIAIGDNIRDLSICYESNAKGFLLSEYCSNESDNIIICGTWAEIINAIS